MSTQKTYPIGGKDYPTTWVQFLDWFHSEQACRNYLETLRWPDGLICPKCGVVSQVQRSSRGRLICPTCRHQATVTAGTISEAASKTFKLRAVELRGYPVYKYIVLKYK